MQVAFLDAIKTFEGFAEKASWDYAQHSNGYGTKALYPGEVIDKIEAERRFKGEISKAQAIVDAQLPDLDDGTRAAMTSLTYNAGTAWINAGLGEALRAGNLEKARSIFLEYNKAGGQVLPGLVARRAAEASWIGAPSAAVSAAGGSNLPNEPEVTVATSVSRIPTTESRSFSAQTSHFDSGTLQFGLSRLPSSFDWRAAVDLPIALGLSHSIRDQDRTESEKNISSTASETV